MQPCAFDLRARLLREGWRSPGIPGCKPRNRCIRPGRWSGSSDPRGSSPQGRRRRNRCTCIADAGFGDDVRHAAASCGCSGASIRTGTYLCHGVPANGSRLAVIGQFVERHALVHGCHPLPCNRVRDHWAAPRGRAAGRRPVRLLLALPRRVVKRTQSPSLQPIRSRRRPGACAACQRCRGGASWHRGWRCCWCRCGARQRTGQRGRLGVVLRQLAVERFQLSQHLVDAQVDLVVRQAHSAPAVGVLADR
jgi:hypothetical protein